MGHIKSNCFKWKRENKGKGKQEKKDRNGDCVSAATTDDLVFVTENDIIDIVSDESSWAVDSGATLHVPPRKEFFTSFRYGDFGSLKMGNNGIAKVVGIGDVCLETTMGM